MFELKLIKKTNSGFNFTLSISDENKQNIEMLFGFKVPLMYILSHTKEHNIALLNIGMSWMSIVNNKKNILDITISQSEMSIIKSFLNSDEIDEYCKIITYSDYAFLKILIKSFNEFG